MKYAIVGVGGRHAMFRTAITKTHPAGNELVALCDVNETRLALSASKVPNQPGNGIATYDAADFDRMIAEQQPDTVIVTTPDYIHHEYIVAALKAGRNVMTEKPMTVDLGKLKAVLDAQKASGKKLTVTFNYRYTPARTQLKDLLMSGAIGEIEAVDFRWYLDRVHGADYFRRWHRYKEKSGGLLVHKSTHHFDLMNWWLGSTPKTVSANGKRVFYTPLMAEQLGVGGTAGHTGKLVLQLGTSEPIGGKTDIDRWTWYHVNLVRDNKTIKVFLNNATEPEIEVAAEGEVPPWADEWFFGGSSDGTMNWEGRLDEIVVAVSEGK